MVYVGYKVPLAAQERGARFKMKKRQGFTLVELVIVVVVLGLLATFAFGYYNSVVEKAKINSAMSTMVEIGKAESLSQMTGGDFVAANNAEEISQSLAIDVDPKYYEYRIAGVADDEFTVLASKIDTGEIVLAMNQNGVFQRGAGISSGGSGTGYGGSGTSSGSSGAGGGTGSGGGGSSSGTDGSTGTGSSGSSGTGSGTSGAGSDGVSSSAASGGGVSAPAIVPSAGGGWSNGSSSGGNEEHIQPELLAAVQLLKNSTYASYAYDLITSKLITVAFVGFKPPDEDAGAMWTGTTGTEPNRIYVNTRTMQDSSDAAIAAVIAHEATHADYDYYGSFWTSTTLSRHPELADATLSYPDNSVLQEYDCMTNSCETWKELKTGPNEFNDDWLDAYEQGTAYFWTTVKTSYSTLSDY